MLVADKAIEVFPTPGDVVIPLLQHTGRPAQPIVEMKDRVTMGQMVARSAGLISACVHASVNGTVGMFSTTALPDGRHVRTIPIRATATQLEGRDLWDDTFGGHWPTADMARFEPKQIIGAITDAGIVDMGEAAFPAHVRLLRNDHKPIDTVLINGGQYEPYLAADYRLMVEAPRAIICGALLAQQATGASHVVVAVEDNKPLAIESLRQAACGSGVRVVAVKARYPMGGERQVIATTLKRKVPAGGLAIDIGVVVQNVATAAAIARAVLRGKPLTHRVVTIGGSGIVSPRNLLAPIGASFAALVKYCGGLKSDALRVIAGGSMMNFAVSGLDTPVTKGSGGLTVLSRADVEAAGEPTCIRCGRRMDACPLRLVPSRLAQSSRHRDWESAKHHHMLACCECGCCAYTCPAGISLAQLIQMCTARLPDGKADIKTIVDQTARCG